MTRLNGLTGTGTLVRLGLRRDRVRLPAWAAGVTLMMVYAVVGVGSVFSTAAERQARADLMSNPAAVVLSGPGYGLENYTLGALIANEFVLTVMVVVAVLSVLVMVRHTRAEEQSGRAELVRAGAVGRTAPLASAVVVVALTDTAVGLGAAVGLIGSGMAVPDSLAVGAAIGVTGLIFAAIAAVAVQLSESTRTATGTALAVLGAAFLLRAVGDAARTGGSAASWASPLGWAQQLRAFVDLRWWPLLLSLVTVLVALVGAAALSRRRDLGAGLLPARPGRADAPTGLRSPAGLAWRLQRGSVIGWGIGVVVTAAATGSLVDGVADLLEENPTLGDVLGLAPDDLVAGFLATMTLFLALLVSGFAVGSALRLREEERSGHAEVVLVAAGPRGRWLAGGVAVTVVGSAVLLLAGGLALGASVAQVTGSTELLGELVLDTFAFLPAVLVLVGVVVALIGLAPRLAGLGWVGLAVVGVIGMFGPALGVPEGVRDGSPFALPPSLVSGTGTGPGYAAVVLAVLALLMAGWFGLRRRDLATG